MLARVIAGANRSGYNPVTALGASLKRFWLPTSGRVTRDGSNIISAIDDSGPANRDGTTGAGSPLWVAAGQEFAGQPYIDFPGSAYIDSGAFAAEAQPRTIAHVFSSTAGDFLFDQLGSSIGLFNDPSGYYVASSTQVATNFGSTLVGVGASNTGQFRLYQDVHVVYIEFNGATTRVFVDGDVTPVATVNSGTTAATQFRLGARNTGGSFITGRVALSMDVAGALSDSARAQLMRWLRRSYFPGQIVCEGDSLTLGRFATSAAYAYPERMQSQNYVSGTPFAMRNFGLGSRLMSTIVTAAATAIDPLYNASRPFNIISLMAGLNDLAADASAAAIYANIVTYANARAAVGWTVIVDTIGDAFLTAPQETRRLALNALIIANASNGAYTLQANDTGSSVEFSDRTNLTWYNADETHWTDAGYNLKAQRCGAAMVAAIP